MKSIMPQYELEEIQNLTDIELTETPITVIQEKITYRQKRVNQLRQRGYTNQQIADKIGCNITTIERDLKITRENVRKWFENNVIIEYCQSINDAVILYENVIEDLQILYQDDIDVETKIMILDKISEFEAKKMKLYEKTRAVQCFRQVQV